MACGSYFNLANEVRTFFTDQLSLKTSDHLEQEILALYPTFQCFEIFDAATLLIGANEYVYITGTADIQSMGFTYAGTSVSGAFCDVFIDVIDNLGTTPAGSFRVNLGDDGVILSVDNNLTWVGDVTFGDMTTGVKEITIGSVVYGGTQSGIITSMSLPLAPYVSGVNAHGYVGCLVPACTPPPAIIGAQMGRIRLGNFEFHLNPLLYRKKL